MLSVAALELPLPAAFIYKDVRHVNGFSTASNGPLTCYFCHDSIRSNLIEALMTPSLSCVVTLRFRVQLGFHEFRLSPLTGC
jgi:hypothetical protein